jgi:hypothetical protein
MADEKQATAGVSRPDLNDGVPLKERDTAFIEALFAGEEGGTEAKATEPEGLADPETDEGEGAAEVEDEAESEEEEAEAEAEAAEGDGGQEEAEAEAVADAEPEAETITEDEPFSIEVGGSTFDFGSMAEFEEWKSEAANLKDWKKSLIKRGLDLNTERLAFDTEKAEVKSKLDLLAEQEAAKTAEIPPEPTPPKDTLLDPESDDYDPKAYAKANTVYLKKVSERATALARAEVAKATAKPAKTLHERIKEAEAKWWAGHEDIAKDAEIKAEFDAAADAAAREFSAELAANGETPRASDAALILDRTLAKLGAKGKEPEAKAATAVTTSKVFKLAINRGKSAPTKSKAAPAKSQEVIPDNPFADDSVSPEQMAKLLKAGKIRIG